MPGSRHGKMIWEYQFNVFQSDAPAHRVGWSSPAADPDTGNVYAIGSGGFMIAIGQRTASCLESRHR